MYHRKIQHNEYTIMAGQDTVLILTVNHMVQFLFILFVEVSHI